MAFGKQHPEWPEFEQRIRKEEAQLVEKLLNPALSHDESNFIRGQVAAMRGFLDNPTPPPTDVGPPGRYNV